VLRKTQDIRHLIWPSLIQFSHQNLDRNRISTTICVVQKSKDPHFWLFFRPQQ
jgi:hypothetical protein